MIPIADYSAVLSQPLFQNLPNVTHATRSPLGKIASPAATFAIQAVEQMSLPRCNLALACLSGPPGATISAFDRAWKLSESNSLVGQDFAKTRSKRIHPFTLARSMQNQVPGMLAKHFAITGAVLNAVDSSTALVYMLPNLHAMLERHDALLLVLSSAGFYEEEYSKHLFQYPNREGLEGAICFLISTESPIGRLTACKAACSKNTASPQPALPYAPCLQAGVGILNALASGHKNQHLVLEDYYHHRTHLEWEGV